MKKILIAALLGCFVLGLCACNGTKSGSSDSPEDNGAVIITRTNASGEVVTEYSYPTNSEENEQTTNGGSGNQGSSSDTTTAQATSVITEPWGEDGFTHVIPEPKIGKQTKKTLSKSGKTLTVSFTGVTYDEVNDYLQEVIDAGFDRSPSNMSVNETIMYFADNADASYNVGVGYSDGKMSVMILRYGG